MNKKHALFVGFIALATIIAVAHLALGADAGFAPPPSGTPTKWPKNASGVTYGASGRAVSPEDEPDLISVVASNGKTGYVYKTDLEEPSPSSPAAAVARQNARAKAGYKHPPIPVYEVDGITQIGEFIVSTGRTELIK